ncbi:MAG: hypothetical protein GXX91_15420 [Verrucomicrobiaceae bacterium]|nr:hypothetical protein [Verrucomicrobiaceae bacterium]
MFLFWASLLAPLSAQEPDAPAAAPPTPPSLPAPADPEAPVAAGPVSSGEVPDPLRPWVDWVLHDLPDLGSPPAYDSAETRLSLWPSRLELDVTAEGATFSLEVAVFSPAWLVLPGSEKHWPGAVALDGRAVPVVAREGRPAVRLPEGTGTITGRFQWRELPQQIQLPPEIGLLALRIGGEEQSAPSWDKDGTLWLQRQVSQEPVDEDFLSLKVHSLIEDGNPLWFETRIEMIVAGKSREETLGSVLPLDWQLAQVEAALPVAIDDAGQLKAQLRAGRWNITLRAFRTDPPERIAFAEGATPAVTDQALAYRARPEFRQAEITGLPQIDVAQTQVPEDWRSLPVYRWDTATAFELVERVRGPGQRSEVPLSIQRSLWLDDDGKALTYQDTLTGAIREIRRLDAAPGHELGSVRSEGEPQLVTHNPEGGAPGFEVRAPQLEVVATGRIALGRTLPATGWRSDAENLRATLQLPPGYRVFALFGADYSRGDWLTSWTLLDIFLLLLFTLAVFRLRGGWAGLLAFVAFGLAYHEAGAPHLPWLLLLIPVALAGSLPSGRWQRVAVGVKWGAAGILILFLVPFLAFQIQGAVFPQLERTGSRASTVGAYVDNQRGVIPATESEVRDSLSKLAMSRPGEPKARALYRASEVGDNLKADPKAIIQTGPGVPAWSWRTVTFGWDGPVSASQEVRPLLIPPVLSRLLGGVRVVCLVLLAGLLLRPKRLRKTPETAEPLSGGAGAGPHRGGALLALVLALLTVPGSARAQFPDAGMLEELKTRLTESSDAFPGAADIASASLELADETFVLQLEYHAAARTAVPVPVPLAALVPGGAEFESGGPAILVRREGVLWTLLPDEGIHRISLRGRVRDRADWEWGFALKPRRISVEAPGWTVSGLRPDGSAEDQLLFARVRREEENAAAHYDRPDTRHALLVERRIELGLVWQVHTTVSRLSPAGRAVALRVPLLPGEKVVSAGRSVEDGAIDIRLAPDMQEISWEGELAPSDTLVLATREDDSWTERWRLVASPIWNVSFSGLEPIFEHPEGRLVPLWQPWPGEPASLTVSRPEAVAGAAVTIDNAEHTLVPGRRQHASSLALSLRTSLGEDFLLTLPPNAEVTTLSHDNKNIPVRKEGDAVVVPLHPGAQSIKVEWRLPADAGGWTRVDAVSLPVEAANVSTVIRPPEDRWLLLADGPQRGPAVQFWGILLFALLVAAVLSRVPRSPLSLLEWLLLSIGLIQVSVFLSLFVVAWLFLLRWRGSEGFQALGRAAYNVCEAVLIFLTLWAVGTFFVIASRGLLGSPEMYIAGNGSSASYLNWFTARSSGELPVPGYWSVSIWWFRLAMLLWALWLAAALVRWLRLGWKNSSLGGHFRPRPPRPVATSAVETAAAAGSSEPGPSDGPRPEGSR